MQAQPEKKKNEAVEIESYYQCLQNTCSVCNTDGLVSFNCWLEQNPSYKNDRQVYKSGNLTHEGIEALKKTRVLTRMDDCCKHPICNICMTNLFFYKKKQPNLNHNECPFCGEWIAGVIGHGGSSKFAVGDFDQSTDLHNIEKCTGCNFMQRGSKAQQLAFQANRLLTQMNYCIFADRPLHGDQKTLFDAMQTACIIDQEDHYKTDFEEMRDFILKDLEKNQCVPCQELPCAKKARVV